MAIANWPVARLRDVRRGFPAALAGVMPGSISRGANGRL